MRSGKVYYYYDTAAKPRREIPLGGDYALAVKKWAELEIDARPRHSEIITFRYVAQRYLREILPTKAPRTQRDNLQEIAQLYKFFDNPPAPIEKITPLHVRQYLDWRKKSPVRANREKALFSHVYNKAREWGYTSTVWRQLHFSVTTTRIAAHYAAAGSVAARVFDFAPAALAR